MSYEDELLAEARAAIGDMHTTLAELRALTAEIVEEGARDIAQDEERDEARARQARRGDFGPEWVRLQQRVDRGETSLAAIAHGWDDSTDAQVVVDRAATNLADVALAMEQEEDEELPIIRMRAEDETAGSFPPEARRAMAEARASMARIGDIERRLRDIPLEDPD